MSVVKKYISRLGNDIINNPQKFLAKIPSEFKSSTEFNIWVAKYNTAVRMLSRSEIKYGKRRAYEFSTIFSYFAEKRRELIDRKGVSENQLLYPSILLPRVKWERW